MRRRLQPQMLRPRPPKASNPSSKHRLETACRLEPAVMKNTREKHERN